MGKKISQEVERFLHSQGFVVVCTIDKFGMPHSSLKGIIDIKEDKVYLLDLYRGQTLGNLKNNPNMSITSVDEHHFKGYCLKGKTLSVIDEKIGMDTLKAWENKIASRLTHRILRNLHGEKGHERHPEALLPNPKYMIIMGVEEVVDLTQGEMKI